MMSYSSSFQYDDLPFFTTMEERTGVKLNLEAIPMMKYTEMFNLMSASGSYANLIEGMEDYTGGIDKAIEDEVIYPFDEIIEDYMPNYQQWLNFDPSTKRTLTSPNENMYSAGYV